MVDLDKLNVDVVNTRVTPKNSLASKSTVKMN
jgi:hypothetical protein